MTNFPEHRARRTEGFDLRASADWYGALFEAEPVLDEEVGAIHHIVFSVGNTLIGLHEPPRH